MIPSPLPEPPVCSDPVRSTTHRALVALWLVLIGCVVVGSLLPAASPIMVGIGRLHIDDKLQHFSAYLALSALPLLAFRERRTGILVGVSMFLLGLLLEGGQHFSPGRAVELGDVVANGCGVGCGVPFAFAIRTLLAIR